LINVINNLNNIRLTLIKRQDLVRIILVDSSTKEGMVESITYSQNSSEPYSTLKIDIRYNYGMYDLFSPGDLILLEANVFDIENDEERFELVNKFYLGRIVGTDNPSGRITFSCRDFMTFAVTSTHSEKITTNELASAFIERTANRFNIPIDSIEETTIPLSSRVLDSSSIYNMWLTALTLEMNKSKLPYCMFMTPLGLVVKRIYTNKKGWLFESQDRFGNIFSSSREITVFDPDFANSVRTYVPTEQKDVGSVDLSSISTNGGKSVSVTDEESVQKYGLFQKDLNVGSMDASEALAASDALFNPTPIENVSLSVPSFFGIKLYDAVYVHNPKIQASSHYFVNGIEMTIQSGMSSMTLELAKIRDLPEATITKISSDQGILSSIMP